MIQVQALPFLGPVTLSKSHCHSACETSPACASWGAGEAGLRAAWGRAREPRLRPDAEHGGSHGDQGSAVWRMLSCSRDFSLSGQTPGSDRKDALLTAAQPCSTGHPGHVTRSPGRHWRTSMTDHPGRAVGFPGQSLASPRRRGASWGSRSSPGSQGAQEQPQPPDGPRAQTTTLSSPT